MVDIRELRKLVSKKINSLLDLPTQEHNHTVGKYYPADAGKCLRRTFFKYKLNVSSEIKERAKGRILMSAILENMYLELLESLGYQTKVKVSKEVDGIEISGEVDAINDEEVIDIKTVTPTAINKIPFPADIAQLNTYLWITDRYSGSLIYVKSDNPSVFHVFPVTYSEKLANETIDRIKKLHQHLIEGTIPDKTENREVCKNCVFRNVCYYIDKIL